MLHFNEKISLSAFFEFMIKTIDERTINERIAIERYRNKLKKIRANH